MSGYSYMTQEGYDKLKAELDYLKTTARREAAAAIAEAREKGDLSENAEYDAAKDAQGLLEAKINGLDKAMANARIISTDDIDTSKVTILAKVTIVNVASKKEYKYELVSETEANIREKKISVNSPIGQGLLGKAVGEIAEVQTPKGTIKFEIKDISI